MVWLTIYFFSSLVACVICTMLSCLVRAIHHCWLDHRLKADAMQCGLCSLSLKSECENTGFLSSVALRELIYP